MIVIYSPKGEEPREYDAEELTCGEADAVCRAVDLEWAQVRQALRSQAPGALRAVAWAWEKRGEPTLRFSAFDPPLKALKARFSVEEIPDFLDMVDRSPAFTPDMRAQVRQEVVALAMDPDGAQAALAAHDAPKEPAPSDAPSDSFAASTSS